MPVGTFRVGGRAGTGVEGVATAVDRLRALVGGVLGIDRHRTVGVIYDVPLDTRIRRPAIDSNIRIVAAAARLRGGELGGDGAVLVVRLGAVPLQADTGQEVARLVPGGAERGRRVGRDRAAAVVRPDGPGEPSGRPGVVARGVLRPAARDGRVVAPFAVARPICSRLGDAALRAARIDPKPLARACTNSDVAESCGSTAWSALRLLCDGGLSRLRQSRAGRW